MSKQPVRVIIGRDVQLTAPGMLGRRFDFKLGYAFLTKAWFSPGEHYEKRDLAGMPSDQWIFVANMGTDLPLIFVVEDVSEVIIPNDTETIMAFRAAPFIVTIKEL